MGKKVQSKTPPIDIRNYGDGFAYYEPVAYLDTLQVHTAKPIPKRIRTELEKLCGRVTYQTLPRKPNYRGYKMRVRLQQPSKKSLELLERALAKIRYRVNWVDVALDVPTDTKADAKKVRDYIFDHLKQPHRGKRECRQFKNSIYYATDPWTARNFAIYYDLPSKVTGGHCAHIEIRTRTRAACRRMGFQTIEDVLLIDTRELWEKHLQLCSIDPAKLEAAIDKKTPDVKRKMRLRYFTNRNLIDQGFKRHANKPYSKLPVQLLKDAMPWLPNRCFKPVLNTLFLPAQPTLVNRTSDHPLRNPKGHNKITGQGERSFQVISSK